MSVLKRRDAGLSSATGDLSPTACGIASAYPSLWEMLSSLKWPDGTVRVPSTLLLFTDSMAVKACLNDRDQGLTAWVSGDSLTGCLTALETGLRADSLDWRAPQGNGTRRVRKKA